MNGEFVMRSFEVLICALGHVWILFHIGLFLLARKVSQVFDKEELEDVQSSTLALGFSFKQRRKVMNFST